MAEWTGEPWEVDDIELVGTEGQYDKRTIAVADDDPNVRTADLNDFRRAAVCVNACFGIDSETVKRLSVRDLLASHVRLLAALRALVSANQAFKTMNVGAPGSLARQAQMDHIEAEKEALAAIATALIPPPQ